MSPIAKALRAYIDESGISLRGLALRSNTTVSVMYRLGDPTYFPKYRLKPETVDKIESAMRPSRHAAAFREAAEATGRKSRFRRPDQGTPFQLMVCDRLIELDRSFEDVVQLSDGRVSKQNISHIVNGKSKRPTDQTIKALAVALELDEADLRKAVAATNEGMTYQLPPQAQMLSAEGWKQVQGFVDYMLEQEKKRDS